MNTRECNKKKQEEAAARAQERDITEESKEENKEDDNSSEIIQVVKKNFFNLSIYKLKRNTALKIILKKNFLKLISLSNFKKWHHAFKRAMVLSNYWRYFSEDYNNISETT
jgi:predicted  nucleic acid-binding Zn-ribbon protein